MKTKYFIIGLLMMVMSFTGYTQIGGSIFDNVKMDSTERKTLKGTYDFFSKEFTDFDGDTMVERCLKVMSDYAQKLAALQDQIENTEDCNKKKELLEYQALLLLSGGTKFFCPDELNSDKVAYGKEIYEFLYPYLFKNAIKIYNYKLFIGLYNQLKEFKDMSEEEIKLKGPGIWAEFTEVFEILSKESEQQVESAEIKLINEILSKYLYAEFKFGNKYSLSPILTKIPDQIADIKKRDEFYIEIVDYLTYYLNPKEFMVKRATEINSMVVSLPCD